MAPSIIAANNYHYYRGGSEAVFFSELDQLRKLGWNVVPFSMHHPQNEPSDWQDHFVEEIELSTEQSLITKIRLAPKSIFSWEARKKIRHLIESVQPDVCHSHNIYHHLSPAILKPIRDAGIPSVMTLHDLKLACPAYNMLTHDGVCERCKSGGYRNVVLHKCINNSIAQSAVVYLEATVHKRLHSYTENVDRFIVPSKFYRDKLIEWGIAADSLVYITNAIDVADFVPRTEFGDYLVYVGRLDEQKGVQTLITAAHSAGKALKIVGTGPSGQSLRKYADQIEANVEFTGYQTGANLAQLVSQSRCLVLPSEGYENAPISVLEAYAMGVPVIGANIGGIPELIHESETGLIFTSGSPGDLTQKILTMFDYTPQTMSEMGRQARVLVEANFDRQSHTQNLLDLYASLGVKT